MYAALERLPSRGRPAVTALLQLLLGEAGEHRQQQAPAGLGRVNAVLDGDEPSTGVADAFDGLKRLQRTAAEAAQLLRDDPL